MRIVRSTIPTVILMGLLAAGCGGGASGDDDGTDASVGPAEGFRIQTPPITIHAGQEVTYCYYTTIPIDRVMGVKRWSSTMTPGSHHLILFFADTGKADGTIDENCSIAGGGLNLPIWTYSAQSPMADATMPAGVGMTVNPGQKVFVQMHYLNVGDSDIEASVTIDAEAYADGETYDAAAAYVTYNTNINVDPMSTGSAEGTCAVPSNATFFTMSTHSHKFSTHTEVRDGTSVVFESNDWEHPGTTDWLAAPHYKFSSGSITYHCDYRNDTQNPVREGDSAATDEMCMAVGYFFVPGQTSQTPKICVNNFVLP